MSFLLGLVLGLIAGVVIERRVQVDATDLEEAFIPLRFAPGCEARRHVWPVS